MRCLSLFSGIGAHDLGFQRAGMEIVGQVEIDEFCQRALQKHFPRAHKWRDIRETTANDIRNTAGEIEIITGGFPCQDISAAGSQAGITQGEKSQLFWEMRRIIHDLRPAWLCIENVSNLRNNGADEVLSSLEASGYSCYPFVVGAIHAGAPHQRSRVWIVGHHNGATLQGTGSTAHESPRREGSVSSDFPMAPGPRQHEWEQPRVVKSAVGAPTSRTARRLAGWHRAALRGIGNANPPQIAELMGRAILHVARC